MEDKASKIKYNRDVKKVNDLWTTHPEIASLLLNPEDGYKYSKSLKVKVDWKCPECSKVIKNKTIGNVYYQGLKCNSCSDGMSFPEKVMYNILHNLNIEFEYDRGFYWSNKKRYDFYIQDLNLLIEVHGRQHYDRVYSEKSGRTLLEEKINDKKKRRMAELSNNKLIEIDCRNSDFEFIKNNILNSELNNYIKIKDVEWDTVKKLSYKSIIKKASDYWVSGIENTLEISKLLSISRNTVINYLKKASDLGWCNYDAKLEMIKNGGREKPERRKKIIRLNNFKVYDSVNDIIDEFPYLKRIKIQRNGRGECKYSGVDISTGEKMNWLYFDDYMLKEASNKDLSGDKDE